MFLKRLDIIGFKSFANKTEVDFSPGLTAVVGPNGSGKSNIADAIRWVLGEQSAKNLRGSKMEDVIFAGSESRKSINFCEVSITLDNTDHHLPVVFDEVTITRRVYRSGESEYLLNKQTCRLKDIHELFMDSGLGRESYSIIGQGKIEEMLSTRPEDRRGPFEDAAGIVKYKFRRKETERKLEETAANILRVDDILAELERQAGPLEKEAERAERFQALQGELTGLDISLLVYDIEKLQEKWKLAAGEVSDLSTHRQLLATVLAEKERDLQDSKLRFEAIHAATEDLQRQLMDGVEERQRTDGDIALLRERLDNARRSRDEKVVSRLQIADEIAELRNGIAHHSERLGSVHARLEIRNADLEVAAHAVDPGVRMELESQIASYNSELIETYQRAATLRNEVRMADEAISQDDRKHDRLKADIEKWETEQSRIIEEVSSQQAKRETLQTLVQDLSKEANETNQKLRSIGEEESACVAELHRLQSNGASLKSRLELLKDLEDGYDGYVLGVKTVLQGASKGRLKGIHGSLASLITVQKLYETAIETALGGSLQNIIVASEADARQAIDMLKQRQSGRATFMPLSVIKGRLLPPADIAKVTGMDGYVGVASTLLSFDSQYQAVVEHLLGNVLVAKTLVHANQLARELGYRVRIVTLDGDVVSPGGTMSGGSHSRKGPGLLGRSRELQDVKDKIAENDFAIRACSKQHESIRAQGSQIADKQQALQTQIRENQQKSAAVDGILRELKARLQSVEERLQGFRFEWNQLTEGQTKWTTRKQQATAELADVETRVQEIEQRIEEKRTELARREAALSSAQEELTSVKVEVATLMQEKQAVEAQVDDMSLRLDRLVKRDGQLDQETAQAEIAITQTEQTLSTTELKLSELVGSVAQLEMNLQEMKQTRHTVELEVSQAEKDVRDAMQGVTAADERLHRAEVTAERTDVELNHALARMGENYKMTFEWARDHYPLVENYDSVKREAERLRRAIAALGDVQLGALEEWKRLSERMTFLHTERADLAQAKEHLFSVIQEIDDEMSKRFSDTFEQIRMEFQVAFRQLFNGGTADLQLTDPQNILHSGVEVIAQPPGKKLQNLNLMSGGERALIAMALLFAILRVRPVPFCVLDEVEAALDEANVGRFAQQLRRFAEDTQFIVITHRRGTMEEADVLYGVTMQESGISSLVSVRLSGEYDVETA